MSGGLKLSFLALVFSLWPVPASTALVEFHNCLSEQTLHKQPLALQLIPQFVDVVLNSTNPDLKLDVTVWANVTGSTAGSAPKSNLPPANDLDYWNSNNTMFGGKIEAIPLPDTINKQTTLYNRLNFLTHKPFSQYVPFCDYVTNGSCPLGPVWSTNTDLSDTENLPSFGFSYNLNSSYALASLAAILKVKYGDKEASEIGCVSVVITPWIGSKLSDVIKFLPVIILVSVGAATSLAAIMSPWGSIDTFRWTTNYGRDPDLLRLVTPGFGDCLQYIQFIALTGGLTINYPGYYQPIVSKLAWSTLMTSNGIFKNSNNLKSVVDGIYVTSGSSGLEKLSKLIGTSRIDNLWNSMAIWLLAIITIIIMTIQMGFLLRWVIRQLFKIHEEDLRAKNMPFSVGNIIRIIFNFFLLPIVTLSVFQMAVASQSPVHTVGLAVLLLSFIIGFAIWLLNLIISTRPKSILFDDLRTVLLYGCLYNTYSDHATSYALFPILLTFVRGIAIGAVQTYGIAQLVLLSICELITMLSIHGFQPFHTLTSMNAYQISFSAIRFTTLILMVSFAPSLGVTERSKGWVGYSILFIHFVVLVLGFWLNAIQTIFEVSARLAGAGDENGLARAGFTGVFCIRQLSRRLPRSDTNSRQSQLSTAAMLNSDERKDFLLDGGRVRSQSSGSTGILGGQNYVSDFINVDLYETIPQDPTTLSSLPSASVPCGTNSRDPLIGSDTTKKADPYYRPPRFRKQKLESITSGSKNEKSRTSKELTAKDLKNKYEQIDETPLTNLVSPKLDTNNGRSKADYTTREVDLYYRVRSPSETDKIQNFRIKSGPPDSTTPTTSAISWLKWLIGSKTKEKGKGFEVVRSSQMPQGAHFRSSTIPPDTHTQNDTRVAEKPPKEIPATSGIGNGLKDFYFGDLDSSIGFRTKSASENENTGLVDTEILANDVSKNENLSTLTTQDLSGIIRGF